MTNPLVPGLIGLIIGVPVGFYLRNLLLAQNADAQKRVAHGRKQDAEREARGILREAEIQGRSEVLKAREAFESSVKEQRKQLQESLSALSRRESALTQREDNLDRKSEVLDHKEQAIEKKLLAHEQAEQNLKSRENTLQESSAKVDAMLTKLSHMTREEARKEILEQARNEFRLEMGAFIRRHKEQALATAESNAREILLTAIQRYAGSHASELMARSLNVPNEDAKGRLIGREGRNIRALEKATGVSITMDDTPETILLSSFDPYRRTIAAVAIERLIKSSRIHPARIEEVVQQVQDEFESQSTELGAQTCLELHVSIQDPRLLNKLGRLHFRTSYSQNVLLHAREVAAICSTLAAEIGLDATLARKVGLLHDIGKALDHEIEGPHAKIGADFLKACGEPQEVVEGVAGHHRETETVTVYAVLAAIGDSISSSRPGARSESFEFFLERIEKIEKIARSFPGVTKAYAVQAGRDLRVLVDPTAISDADATVLARDICLRIENEQQFPGQIRITIIRETRCVEYAH